MYIESSRHAHGIGDPGVGAIGMCVTGNFALAMMLEPSVLAPVMSQPSLPLDYSAGTFITPTDMDAVKVCLDAEDLTVMAVRFDGDPYCTAARFDAFARALGDRFVLRVLPDDDAGDVGWLGAPHSVVPTCLIDESGELTAAIRDEILAFFASRLHA